MEDKFSLYNLEISVTGDPETFVCSHEVGPAFQVVGEDLVFDTNKKFSMYGMAALLPLLAAKQRETHQNDWMTTDQLIACPDPNCGARFKIDRLDKSEFRHSEVTNVPLTPKENS